MQKKTDMYSVDKPDRAELPPRDVLSDDWRVLMAKHPQTGFYYAAGIKLGR